MTGDFEDDFAAALRGDSGYRGIEPKTAAALYRLGLITEEQAWKGARVWQQEWRDGWDSSKWWHSLAEIAWQQYGSFREKLLLSGLTWRRDWIRERRGW